MQITAIQCKKCKAIVYSRTTHDMRTCPCGAVSIDGGREYVRICGDYDGYILIYNFEVKATPLQLYKDWNSYADKYGVVKPWRKNEKKVRKAHNSRCG